MLNLKELLPKRITLNSRQVALMVGKRHDNLIRDIETYIKQMKEANKITTSKLRTSDIKTLNSKMSSVNQDSSNMSCRINSKEYFIKSGYLGENGEKRPCYKITKMGCDFIAHKMTGVKGTAFTALYIKKFYEMEDKLKLELQTKEDFKEMTDAIKQVKENPKPYNFTNEINMINKIALGCTSKQFKLENDISQNDKIRKYLPYEQLQLIDALQKINAALILIGMNYSHRKIKLQDYRLKLAA
jgi:phage regulator Rha-like protein